MHGEDYIFHKYFAGDYFHFPILASDSIFLEIVSIYLDERHKWHLIIFDYYFREKTDGSIKYISKFVYCLYTHHYQAGQINYTSQNQQSQKHFVM